MAKTHGKNGTIKVLVTATETAIGEIKKYTLESAAETVDTKVLSSEWDEHDVGLKSWSGSAECHFDAADPAQELMAEGLQVEIYFYPESDAAESNYLAGTATITGCSIVVENPAIVAYNITLKGDGELSRDALPES